MDRILDDIKLADLVQIGGLIRFSCPFEESGFGSFKWQFGDMKEMLAALFETSRMEERFLYFEKVCLHTLRRQTNKNFTVGVLVSEHMPATHRHRMDKLLSDFPQARQVMVAIQPYRQAIEQGYAEVFDRDTPYRLSFRLDDDDAVAVDFIEQVYNKAPHLIGLSEGKNPVALSFLKKLTLHGMAGARKLEPKIDGNPLGLGLCMLSPRESRINAYTFVHWKMVMHAQTVLDMGPLMNLRCFHTSNDSEMKTEGGRELKLSEAEIRRLLHSRFAMDMDELLAL